METLESSSCALQLRAQAEHLARRYPPSAERFQQRLKKQIAQRQTRKTWKRTGYGAMAAAACLAVWLSARPEPPPEPVVRPTPIPSTAAVSRPAPVEAPAAAAAMLQQISEPELEALLDLWEKDDSQRQADASTLISI